MAGNLDEWLRIQRAVSLQGSFPKVDFALHMIVAVGLGTRSTSGYEVTILGLKKRDRVLYVRCWERIPSPNEFVTQALTTPYHVMLLLRMDAPKVLFEKIYRPKMISRQAGQVIQIPKAIKPGHLSVLSDEKKPGLGCGLVAEW